MKRIDIAFFSLALICSAIMVASVALPYVSRGYDIDRAYLLMTVVLSSFFVLGGMTVAELIRVRWKYLVVLVVLVPFFMVATGTMHQVFGCPESLVLNSEGRVFDILYVHDQETISAKWIKEYFEETINSYGDFFIGDKLRSQGGIIRPICPIDLIKGLKPPEKAYIYLGYCNVVKGKLLSPSNSWQNVSEYKDEFARMEKIYTNAGSEMLMI